MNKPFLKWVGGKRQLLPELDKYIPHGRFNRYIEPFVGGGALFFHLNHTPSIIGDSNPELINAYVVVRDNVDELISMLKSWPYSKDFFYGLRSVDVSEWSAVRRAARFIYFNKTAFNGLWRVNKNGQFNASFGDYKNPKICDEETLRIASLVLKDTQIVSGYYQETLLYTEGKDFVFLDPPYVPVSVYSDFKRYTKEQFYIDDHVELSRVFRELSDKGVFVILTNSNTEIINELYQDFERIVVQTRRNVNKKANLRSKGEDVIILSRNIRG